MTTIRINYPTLEDAAKQALNVATEMTEYADAIPGKITNPLGSLTGGSSSNTSTVQSLASQKASDLRKRASRYQNLSSQITSFVSSAREADAQVKRRITDIADREAEKLSLWQRISYEFYKLYNGIVGSTPLGAFFNNLLSIRDRVKEELMAGVQNIIEWFQHGEGRYVLNMAWSVIVMAGAIVALVSFLATAAAVVASGGLLGVVILAALHAVVVTVSVTNTAATIYEGVKALSTNNTHPGVARYYGNTSSISDLAKKETTDATAQSIAAGIDLLGTLAGLAVFAGNVFTTSAGGKTLLASDFTTIKNNLAKQFGFKLSSAGGYTLQSPVDLTTGIVSAVDTILPRETIISSWTTSLTASLTGTKGFLKSPQIALVSLVSLGPLGLLIPLALGAVKG